MDGVARFKSHVLRRDEKGMFGIAFKRWLAAGCVAGFAMVISRMFVGDLATLVAIASGIAGIRLSAQRGGLPRWRIVLLDWQWRLLAAKLFTPNSFLGVLAGLVQLPIESMDVDAESIFMPTTENTRTRLVDWVSYSDADLSDEGDGLIFIDSLDQILDAV
jgi:hypothetical protein